MSGDSKISWTTKTWNPVHGCSKVSEGCDFCYAERLSVGRGWTPAPWTKENEEQNVLLKPGKLLEPFGYKCTECGQAGREHTCGVPIFCFVNSMSDLFHQRIPTDYTARVFAVMAATPWITYQILTKRPGPMASILSAQAFRGQLGAAYLELDEAQGPLFPDGDPTAVTYPLPNVWLGTSVENQRWTDVRVPLLLRVPAAIRFLSCEPLLGPIDLRHLGAVGTIRVGLDALDDLARARVDWIIVGGESGPHLTGKNHPRWMRMEWARALRDQAVEAGVAFFFKQDSGRTSEQRAWVVDEDGTKWRWHQYPGDLRPPDPVP